jgi:hypothetical protein
VDGRAAEESVDIFPAKISLVGGMLTPVFDFRWQVFLLLLAAAD